jgi:cytochrome c oxidase cbb3-type subunit III
MSLPSMIGLASAHRHFSPGSHLVGDTLSLDETKLNETKHLNLRQADSVVYQVHRLMSLIPKKAVFTEWNTLRLPARVSLARVTLGSAESEKRDVTWRIVLNFGLVLLSLGAAGNIVGQNPDSKESASGLKLDVAGKNVFEGKCATCHGLDGLGGEHAPDIVRRPDLKALSDEAWLKVIHDGIPEEGMPGFPSLGGEDAHAVVAYLRFLQGRSARNWAPGDPARGHDLFFGKAGCSACHQIVGRGQFVAGDLGGFARDHPADEIRDAVLRPTGGPQEIATAVARDGRKFSGLIRNEDNASLQLQDGDGRFYLLIKSGLISIERKSGDPMPVGYGRQLSSTELDDLVGYILREARTAEHSSSPSVEGHAQD